MSRESSKSSSRRKHPKPKGFPLTYNPCGQWSKKITLPSGKKKVFYFGPLSDPDAALERFNREWPYLKEGRTPPPISAGNGCTLADACNKFLAAKRSKVESGELSGHSFGDYLKTAERMVAHFGRERLVDDLRPDDFEGFRESMAKTLGPVALRNEINRVRIVLKYAYENRLIAERVCYGAGFGKPSARTLRKAKNEAGANLLEAAEIRRMLEATDGLAQEPETGKQIKADPILKAMVLLGVNCGFGNTDVANLPKSAIDFAGAWINYPRPKTEIPRRIKLWPETVQALGTALEHRPNPKDAADADMVFLTVQGKRYVRCTASKTTADKFAIVNTVTNRFGALLKRLGINGRRRLGFYTLRHCFETAAGESKDQVAVDAIMGHVDPSMGANYRERISDERLQAVVETVRAWLFGCGAAGAADGDRADAGQEPQQGPQTPLESSAIQRAVCRCLQAIAAAEGPDKAVLRSVWNESEIARALSGESWTVEKFLRQWGDPA